MNLKRWFHEHSLKLLAIRDTPEAIAGGVAIGVFFGFTPLFGIKTASAIVLAWLTRSNIIAAVIAVTLHDILWPFMPAIYLWEYKIGFWVMSNPHEWPPPFHRALRNWDAFSLHTWSKFLFGAVGQRLVLGGAICALPFAVLSFFVARAFVARHQRKKQLPPVAP